MRNSVWNCRDRTINFCNTTQFDNKKKKMLLSVTSIPSSIGWGAVRLLNLHNSKRQSMEEGPFVRNCQRRQGPQAWSPRVKSAYLGCHSDMTGPEGQGRGVKLLTTLNVTPALLYYERQAKWLTSSTVPKVTWYIFHLLNLPKNVHIYFPFTVIHTKCICINWSVYHEILSFVITNILKKNISFWQKMLISWYFGHDMQLEKPVCIKLIYDIVM